MHYIITVEKKCKALQGLKSSIRDAKGKPALQPTKGYALAVVIGVEFNESQLNERGWFIDTDSLDETLEAICSKLTSQKWTELFDFRPTFEHVTRWIYYEIEERIPQLSFVEIHNQTINTKTRFGKE